MNNVLGITRLLKVWLFILCLCLLPQAAAERLPDLIGQVAPAEIFPGADRFGTPEGSPMTAKVFGGGKELGVVYITSDVVNTRGYSGKPIDTMVALDKDGTVAGAKLLTHSEPIVLIGIPQEKIDRFIQGYVGLNPTKNPPASGETPSEIVSGATVTVVVIGDSILRSARTVTAALAKQSGQAVSALPENIRTRPHRLPAPDKDHIQSWQQLLDSRALGRLHLRVGEINKMFADSHPEAAAHPEKGADDDTFIDLYAAVVSQPSVGKSLLGEQGFAELQSRLKPKQAAIVVAGEGVYSFKGSGYVRGGIFDRIEVIQRDNGFRFTDLLHTRLLSLTAAGAPAFKEIALFVTPEDFDFDPAEPWRLQLLVQRELGVQNKAFLTVDLNYALPQELTVDDPDGEPVALEAAAASATPVQAALPDSGDNPQKALWKQIWAAKILHVAVLAVMLAVLCAVFFFQDTLVRYETAYRRFRLAYLTLTLFYVGWYLQAQLSVVNVMTFTSALMHGFSWDYFLMDPFVFTLWCATAVSMLFWGRGAFCGWLCPFGALQELSNTLAKKIGIRQKVLPFGLHTRLTAVKYVLFMGLFGVSLYDLGMAERFAEVEPFKTAVILKFMREWWFVLFALALLTAGLFVERFFCRYLCPLGAALAVPAKLQIFNWLRRYPMCGNPCQICRHECPVQAIHPEGNINANECIQCLHCQVMYNHTSRCPQVVAVNKKKARQAAAKAERAEAQPVHFIKPSARHD